MAYDTLERSEQDAAPVELYEFYHGNDVYRYTSAEMDVEFESQAYTSEAIRRSSIALSIEQPRNAIALEVRRNLPVADLFRAAHPLEPVGLIVKRFHRDDSDVGTIWVGRVLNCSWQSTTTAVLNCEPASISGNRNGLARYYQVPCPYALFDPDSCRADRTAFDHATVIDAMSGLSLTVDSLHSTLPYPGGWVEWANNETPPTFERRLIVSRSGLVLTLNRPFSSAVAVNDAVTVFPGCDHTKTTCNTHYNNILNYGGFDMPTKNPFEGPPVY